MNTIYKIYERMYNSILSDIEDTISIGDEISNAIKNSMQEKFIKIVSLASEMTPKEEKIFRTLVTNTTINGKNKYAICIIPRKIMTVLIKESGSKLKKTDFDVFPKDEKEYNGRVLMAYSSISQECGSSDTCKEIIKTAKENPGQFVYSNYIKCIKLGTALILQDDAIMYLEINDSTCLVLRTLDDISYNSKFARNFTYNA